MPLPTEVLYGKVVGKYLLAIGDGVDVGDKPDGVAAAGTVTFTPSHSSIQFFDLAEPVTIVPATITCTLDSSGQLIDEQGAVGVYLVATESELSTPASWSYKVKISITGNKLTRTFDISVPAGGTVDLTTAAPALVSSAISAALLESVTTARDETLTARDQTVALGSTNDAIIASRVSDAASATRTALSATYATLAAPTFTGSGVKVPSLAVGAGVKGQKRTPVFANVVIDGSTLGSTATDGTDKVANGNIVTIKGGFSGEAAAGVSNPAYVWGANDFIVSGNTAGDLAGLSNFWARLTEAHIYTPSASLTNVFGMAAQSNVQASATSATISGWLASFYATGPVKNAPSATIANAASVYVLSPAAGVATAQYTIYQGGTTAPNFFGAASTFNDGLTVNSKIAKFDGASSGINNQGAAAGVYAGTHGGNRSVSLSDGTNHVALDLNGTTFRFMKAGVHEAASVTLDGDLKARRGFSIFNTTLVTAKPTVTGSRGSNAALASLLTALASYGLITDSSS